MSDLVQMTDNELKQLHEVNLKMAKYICEFCKKHNLRIYLYAGSLLGAVRDHGFIPWDDDMDMMMPAPDYEKFLELWEDTDQYSLCRSTKENNDKHLATTIRDNYTTFIVENSVDLDTNQGVGIDFGAMHAAAKTKIGHVCQLICATGASLFKAGRVPNRRGLPWKIGAKILLGIFRGDKVRYFFWSHLEKLSTIPDKKYESAKYVKELGIPPYMFWLFPKEWFDEVELTKFEDTELPIPKGAKNYLEKRYGDYMKLPPEKDRHPEHRIVFMDLNTPYKEYRGVKYFVNQKK